MKKRIACLAVLTAAVCMLAGCTADSGTSSAIQGTESEISTVLHKDTHESIPYAITEEEARAVADKALWDACARNEFGLGEGYEVFAFESAEILQKDEKCIAYNGGYGSTSETENMTGHAYYAVYYSDTAQISGFAYICVDAITGDVLFVNYMGD